MNIEIVNTHDLLIEIGIDVEGRRVFTAPFAVGGRAASLEPQTSPDHLEHIHALSCIQDIELQSDSVRKKSPSGL